MKSQHLTMVELLAVRDGDRSEPSFAMARLHIESCSPCSAELDRLHQRVAQMRALPLLAPSTDVFGAVRQQLAFARRQRLWRAVASVGVAAAAGVAIWIVGQSVAAPPPLSAEAQIADVKSASEHIQERIAEWAPKQRALDGGTVIVVIQLEDQIADVDRQLQQVTIEVPSPAVIDLPINKEERRLEQELKLWREREGLLNALLNVHVNRTVRIDM